MNVHDLNLHLDRVHEEHGCDVLVVAQDEYGHVYNLKDVKFENIEPSTGPTLFLKVEEH